MKDANCPKCGAAWSKADSGEIRSMDMRLCPKMHSHGGSYITRYYTCANGHYEPIYRSGWRNIEGCPHVEEPQPWPSVAP